MEQILEIDEFILLQNPIVGSQLIYQFTKEYYSVKNRGIKLPFSFMVLPIAFSKDFSDEIYRRSYKLGSMIKSLNNNTLNWDSLPLKMKSFSEITFQSLNIAFSTSILFYDKENAELIPNRGKSIPDSSKKQDYDKMLKTARRLGHWLGNLEDEEICSYYNITF